MKKYTLILILILAVSCSKQHRVEEHTVNTEQSDNNIINEALKAMEMIYGSGTKSMSKGFSYHNIIPATKSNPDMSLHVVNFEENSGFVAFAGNEEDPILLGISNNGNLNIEALENNLSSPQSYFLPIDTPENEVDDPEDMLYYDNDTTSIESSDFTDFIHIELDFDDGSTDLYFGPVEGLMADNLRFIDSMEEFESMIGDQYPPQNWGEWEDYIIVPTIIRSKWHQFEPYNGRFPIVNGKRLGVGCGAIVTGQIESFYGIPAHNNWDVISKFDIFTSNSPIKTYENHSQEDSTIIADYIYELSQDLGADLENNSVSINIYKIRRYFRNRLGLLDTRINKWNWPRVKERIKIGVPVIMSGHGPNGGHAWIVDGYMTQKRDNQAYPYQTFHRDLMHINWGHGGVLDGYYFIGNFNKYEGAVGINKNDGDRWPLDFNDSTSYYDTNIKIMTWSKP